MSDMEYLLEDLEPDADADAAEADYDMNDDHWIKDFEEKEKLYQDFYADDVFFTKLHFIYIDRENSIEKITEENYLLPVKNQISRHELIQILKRVTLTESNKYSLLSILKCNIKITQDNVKNFLSCKNVIDYHDEFVTPIKNIDTIYFEKTINMFQDLTDVFFLLYKNEKNSNYSSNSTTKRIYISKAKNKKKNNKTKKNIIV